MEKVVNEQELAFERNNEQPDEAGKEADYSYPYMFTVFTPTYNRAHTLHRVYESLLAQTDQDFEWLIVDDGSLDNTHELVEHWLQTAPFPIRYFHQGNQGKHVAYNLAVKQARGEFLICLDSDDRCVPTALERFRYHWNTIPLDKRSQYSGVDCHCQDEHGNLQGTWYPLNPMDSNACEIRYRYKVKGEKWGMQRTEVMKQFLFPEDLEGKARFVPEAIVWSRMTKQYPARYVNECLRIFYDDPNADRETTRNFSSKAVGIKLLAKSILEVDIDYFWYEPLTFLKAAANYSRSSFHLRIGLGKQFGALQTGLGQFLWLCMVPVGWLLWIKDRLKA
jgi:glycosyltransferase involved in cell wall biosynthesis